MNLVLIILYYIVLCPFWKAFCESDVCIFFKRQKHAIAKILVGCILLDMLNEGVAWYVTSCKFISILTFAEISLLYECFLTIIIMQALRFFVGVPVWTPYNRPHDHLPARYDLTSLVAYETIRGLFLSNLILRFQCAESNISRLLWKMMLPTILLMPLHKIWFCPIVVWDEKY